MTMWEEEASKKGAQSTPGSRTFKGSNAVITGRTMVLDSKNSRASPKPVRTGPGPRDPELT